MAVARVQAVGNTSTGTGTVTVTITAATAGNLLVGVGVVNEVAGGDKDINTPTGFTAITPADINATTKLRGRMWYKVAAGGETAIAFTSASGTSDMAAYVIELSGTAASSPEDQTNEATGSTSPTTTGSITPAAGAVGVAFTAINNNNNLTTPQNSYTLETTVLSGNATAAQAIRLGLLYNLSPGAAATGVTQSGTARTYIAQIASFKAAAGTTFNQTLAVSGGTWTAAMVRSPGKVLAVASTMTAAMVKSVNKPLAVAATFTAVLLKSVGKPLAVTGSWVAALVKRANKPLSVTVTFTAAMVRSAGKVLGVTATYTVAFVRGVGKGLSTGASWGIALVKRVNKTLAVSGTWTAAMSGIKAVQQALNVTVTFTASMVRRTNKTLAAAGTWTAAMTKRVGKTLAASGSWVANLIAISTVKPIQALVALFDRMWTAVFLRDRQTAQITDMAQTQTTVSHRAMTTVQLSDRAVQPNTATNEEV